MPSLLPSGPALLARLRGFLEGGAGAGLRVMDGEGRVRHIDSLEAEVLRLTARPLETAELEGGLRRGGWEEGGLEELPALLASLEARGLLAKLEALLGEAPSETPNPDEAALPQGGERPAFLALPSADRPELLERALAAWEEAFARSELPPPAYLIADDSRSRAEETGNLVEAFAARARAPVFFFDKKARRDLAASLSSLAPEALAFALGSEEGPGRDENRHWGQSPYGITRNTLFLAAAGRSFVSTDDDALPDFRRLPGSLGAEAGLALSAHSDPWVLAPQADPGACLAYGEALDGDPFAPHSALLGASTRQLIAEAGFLDASEIDYPRLSKALAPRTRVLALCFGSWGDSASSSNRHLILSRRAVKATGSRIYEDGQAYRQALEGRLIFRGARRTTLGGSSFVACHVAYDNRSLLPPYSPLGRDGDGLWGRSLGLFRPTGLLAYPVEAIRHQPEPGRGADRGEARRFRPSLCDCLLSLQGLLMEAGLSGRSAYAGLGGRLIDLGKGSRVELRRALAETVSKLLLKRLEYLERVRAEAAAEEGAGSRPRGQAERGAAMADWKEDLLALEEDLIERLDSPNPWLPLELEGREEGAEELLADYILHYGLLLEAWPSIFEEARRRSGEILEGVRVRGGTHAPG